MSITITGGQGFIGTALQTALSGVLSYTAVPERCENMAGRIGTLIHLASSISDIESSYDPEKYIDNNIRNFTTTLKNNSFDKIIFPSSATVYDKDGNLDPDSVYGITKLTCEKLVKLYCKECWILRIANPIGPSDKKTVFARLAQCKKRGDAFTIYRGENIVRDFFPVEHLTKIMLDILQGKIKPGVYNIGSGKKSVVADTLRSVCEQYGIRYTMVDPPSGLNVGYVPTTNLLACDEISVKEEWKSYLL